ncbi:MAG: pseudouridine synthase [Patescibacteria group bacterium]
MPIEPTYPMRINRYLAWKKYATRRGADKLIEAGLVLVNGRGAKIGEVINEKDQVAVRQTKKPKAYTYVAYHKPRGTITHSPIPNLFPVGRLDKDSSGLLLLTDDGRITDRLLNPDHTHEKEYVVTTREPLRSNFVRQMSSGVVIDDYTTRLCQVESINDYTFRITLTEGKKHQIRQMCAALSVTVNELTRLRIMNIRLGQLTAGSHRPLTTPELSTFLKSLGL